MADEAPDKAECERIFKRFDVNGDGHISLAELSDAVKTLGLNTPEEELRRGMAEIDKDGDGCISLEELWEFFCAHPRIVMEVCKKL